MQLVLHMAFLYLYSQTMQIQEQEQTYGTSQGSKQDKSSDKN